MALLRVKRRFLQGPGIFVLCPHVWTHGVTIAIGRVKGPEGLESLGSVL